MNNISDPLSVILAAHDEADSTSSFAHAIKLALASRGELEIIDIRKNADLAGVTGVRSTLEKWGLLKAGSKRHDVQNLGMRIKKIIKSGNSPNEIKKRLQKKTHDLLVMSVGKRVGIKNLLGRNLVAYLGGNSRQTTLYIPENSRPIINSDTGEVNLSKIFIPITNSPGPEMAINITNRLIAIFPDQNFEITGFHCGEIFPAFKTELINNIKINQILKPQNGISIAQQINEHAENNNADLIVMTTNGRDTISQRILGSITENVLAKAMCPVLAVAAV